VVCVMTSRFIPISSADSCRCFRHFLSYLTLLWWVHRQGEILSGVGRDTVLRRENKLECSGFSGGSAEKPAKECHAVRKSTRLGDRGRGSTGRSHHEVTGRAFRTADCVRTCYEWSRRRVEWSRHLDTPLQAGRCNCQRREQQKQWYASASVTSQQFHRRVL
jgi:hypothetical protein